MKTESLRISLEMFSSNIIQKVFYKYATKHAQSIEVDSDQNIVIIFSVPSEYSETKISEIKSGFMQELVDQNLREVIAKETELVRNLILANAFSNAPI